MKYNRPMNVFEKLQSGWYWIGEIFDEWCYTMRNDDGEFFNYLQSDYVKYEEDMYYVRKEQYVTCIGRIFVVSVRRVVVQGKDEAIVLRRRLKPALVCI